MALLKDVAWMNLRLLLAGLAMLMVVRHTLQSLRIMTFSYIELRMVRKEYQISLRSGPPEFTLVKTRGLRWLGLVRWIPAQPG